MRIGAAVRDVTPASPVAMVGYAARTEPSVGVADPITVRALVVGRTAVVTVDVCGLDEPTCAAIRRTRPERLRAVVVHATHTHAGPACLARRLGGGVDPVWLERLIVAAGDALVEAVALAEPGCRLLAGYADEPGIARNRRRTGGPVDPNLPVVQAISASGAVIATLVSYACHPVVLGPDNRELSADYAGAVRSVIEQTAGGVALFLTGCAGDANPDVGDPADSFRAGPDPTRTIERARGIGTTIARAALEARLEPAGGGVVWAVERVALGVQAVSRRQRARELAAFEAASDDPLAACWASWARGPADPVEVVAGRVTAYRWGSVRVVTLPGEPFAASALRIRSRSGGAVTVVAGYTDGVAGYLPPREEWARGGYEVEQAHRYYGLAGPLRRGSAERLERAAARALGRLT